MKQWKNKRLPFNEAELLWISRKQIQETLQAQKGPLKSEVKQDINQQDQSSLQKDAKSHGWKLRRSSKPPQKQAAQRDWHECSLCSGSAVPRLCPDKHHQEQPRDQWLNRSQVWRLQRFLWAMQRKERQEEVETDEGRGAKISGVDERSRIWCQEGDETPSTAPLVLQTEKCHLIEREELRLPASHIFSHPSTNICPIWPQALIGLKAASDPALRFTMIHIKTAQQADCKRGGRKSWRQHFPGC